MWGVSEQDQWHFPSPRGWIQNVPTDSRSGTGDFPPHARPRLNPLPPDTRAQPRRPLASRTTAGACCVDTEHLAVASGAAHGPREGGPQGPLGLVSPGGPVPGSVPRHWTRGSLELNGLLGRPRGHPSSLGGGLGRGRGRGLLLSGSCGFLFCDAATLRPYPRFTPRRHAWPGVSAPFR